MCSSTLGTGPKTLWAASPASPPRCPLPLLSRRIRTRPSRTALSSEANTNQPQMFMLGGKGRQMQSHSIKLASLPLCPLRPSFPDFLHRAFIAFCVQMRRPGECFRSVGVTSLQHSESPGFPLLQKKRKERGIFLFLPSWQTLTTWLIVVIAKS